MPHIDIKHFPVKINEEVKEKFIESLIHLVTTTFLCNKDAISISIEPIIPEQWDERVYSAEIVPRKKWLNKKPGYGLLSNKK